MFVSGWRGEEFRPARPKDSLRGGRGLVLPDEILGLSGRNWAIEGVTGRHFFVRKA